MNEKSPAGMSIHSVSTDWNTPTKYIDLVYKMFDVVELEKEILRKSKVMIEKENIEVEFQDDKPI